MDDDPVTLVVKSASPARTQKGDIVRLLAQNVFDHPERPRAHGKVLYELDLPFKAVGGIALLGANICVMPTDGEARNVAVTIYAARNISSSVTAHAVRKLTHPQVKALAFVI